VLFKTPTGRFGTRYSALYAQLARRQGVDEVVHRGTRSHSDNHVVFDVLQRRFGSELFVSVGAHRGMLLAGVQKMPIFSGFKNDCARFRGHNLYRLIQQKNYFFLAAFFLPAFFLDAFLPLVAMLMVSVSG
jgi:hypothetical protein